MDLRQNFESLGRKLADQQIQNDGSRLLAYMLIPHVANAAASFLETRFPDEFGTRQEPETIDAEFEVIETKKVEFEK